MNACANASPPPMGCCLKSLAAQNTAVRYRLAQARRHIAVLEQPFEPFQ